MNTISPKVRRVTRENAKKILVGTAYAQWAEELDFARQIRSSILEIESLQRLIETLQGIEQWLDNVYERGVSVAEADYEFIGSAYRCRGLGHSVPSRVIEREVGDCVFSDALPELQEE
jgi:hypothetical protein